MTPAVGGETPPRRGPPATGGSVRPLAAGPRRTRRGGGAPARTPTAGDAIVAQGGGAGGAATGGPLLLIGRRGGCRGAPVARRDGSYRGRRRPPVDVVANGRARRDWWAAGGIGSVGHSCSAG